MARRFRFSLVATTATVLACSIACGSSDDGSGSGSGDNNDSNGDGFNDDTVFFDDNGNGANGGGSNGSGDFSGTNFAACAGESAATEAAPLSIYIMFDQSCSMSCPPELAGPGQCCLGDPRPRIDQVRSAVNDFLNSPDSAGINVGIGYFGYFPSGNTSCNPDDYSRAAVPIGPLPGNAGAIANSLNSISPVGETPTGAAIRGACTYAQGWRNENPGFNVVTLLVTDGVPETPVSRNCDANLPDAENAAGECSQAGVPTYVLGVGANLDNLSRLAQAG
jgi:hypothetical protein